jgi:translation initiation factor IF-1|tara:strand:+ start:71 stop:304 length:234 start_codon:yes stop_codon:yes gene_type:complete
MSKTDYVEFQGEVLDVYPGGKFSVQIETEDGEQTNQIVAHISGKMRLNRINILVGDIVTVEISPYDLTQGRITYRHK